MRIKGIDNKQWIPVYGMYKVTKDLFEGKPSMADEANGPVFFWGTSIYHGVVFYWTCSGIADLVTEGLEKLLK